MSIYFQFFLFYRVIQEFTFFILVVIVEKLLTFKSQNHSSLYSLILIQTNNLLMLYFFPFRFAFHRWGVSHTCWFVQKGGSSKPGRDSVILSSPKYALRWRMLTSPTGQRSPCSTLTPLTPQPPQLLLRVPLQYEIFKNGVRGRSEDILTHLACLPDWQLW